MTDKITIDRAVVEQAIELMKKAWNTTYSDTLFNDFRDGEITLRAALDQPALAQRTPIRFNDAPEHIYLQVCDLDEDECNKPFSAHEEVCWSSESHHESDVLYVREDKAQQPAVPPGYKLLKNSTHAERSWPEDASHENGSYHCTCVNCGREFVGYKRRVVCRVCDAMLNAAPEAPAAQKEQP